MLTPLDVHINAKVKRAYQAVGNHPREGSNGRDALPGRTALREGGGMRHFFGFTKEPFSQDIRVDELYHTAALEAVKERFSLCRQSGGCIRHYR